MDQRSLKEIAFFGKITAGITHELKNVLAVIKETSGLMGDLLNVSDLGTFQYKEKFEKAISTIERQIEHGVSLLNHLNKFAHAPDKEMAEIDLYDTVNEMTVLCSRYARLKNITLSVLRPDRLMKLTTCQVSLQMVLFACLDYCISRLPQQAQITISVEQKETNDAFFVTFNCTNELLNTDNISTENKPFNTLEKLEKAAYLVKGSISRDPLTLSLILSPKP